jgi:hypothetical protein
MAIGAAFVLDNNRYGQVWLVVSHGCRLGTWCEYGQQEIETSLASDEAHTCAGQYAVIAKSANTANPAVAVLIALMIANFGRNAKTENVAD